MKCLIDPVFDSGAHAHRWGSERITQRYRDTRSETGGHQMSGKIE